MLIRLLLPSQIQFKDISKLSDQLTGCEQCDDAAETEADGTDQQYFGRVGFSPTVAAHCHTAQKQHSFGQHGLAGCIACADKGQQVSLNENARNKTIFKRQ